MEIVTRKIAIIGARALTAEVLIQRIVRHPWLEVAALQARVDAPEPVERTFPALRGLPLPTIDPIDLNALPAEVEAVFLCLPHTVAAEFARELVERNLRVFDLSADFRFFDHKRYEAAYGVAHPAPELCRQAVYGLPELYRAQIAGRTLIACPGCYPTSVILGLAPLMKRDMLWHDSVIADCKSGVSGAGRNPSETTHYVNVNESFSAYKVAEHRHQPEIEAQLSRIAGEHIGVTFVPHLVPMDRGILATCYGKLKEPLERRALEDLYERFYQKEPFVRVLRDGSLPTTKAVAHSNYCDIAVRVDAANTKIVVLSAIDNLGKGASTQAIQCANVSFGFAETDGLH